MNINNLVFWVLLIFTLLTTCLIVGTGMMAVYPRRWDQTIYKAGVEEVRRRVEGLGSRSQSDHVSAARLIGGEPILRERRNEEEQEDQVLEIIMVFTNLTDEDAVRDELSTIRDRLEASAVQMQLRLVDQVRSMRIASFLWLASGHVNQVHFAFRGFIWFFPQALPYLARRLQKYAIASLIGGVVLGLLVSAMDQSMTSQRGSVRWIPVVSDMGTIATVLALVIAMLGIYKELLVARFGPLRQWTRRGTLTGAGFVLFIGATMYLTVSGQFSRWQLELTRFVQAIEFDEKASLWIGGLLGLFYIAYLVRRGYQWVRQSSVSMKDRLGTATATVLIIWIFALGGAMALGVPIDVQAAIALGGCGLIVIMTGLAGAAAIATWVKKLRTLRKIRWPVKRWGFRIWAVLVWFAIVFVAQWMGSWIGAWAQQVYASSIAGYAATYFFGIVYAVLVAASIPGAVAALLYVRGVSRAYDAFVFSLAPPHPQRTE